MGFCEDDEPDEDRPDEPYTQCLLVRGYSMRMEWLPAAFAKLLGPLKLRNGDGSWDNGWTVKQRFQTVTFRELNALKIAAKRKYHWRRV